MVVSVRANSPKQLQQVLDLTVSSWTERPGLGQITIQIKKSDLPALRELGVNPIVQIADLQTHNQDHWADLVRRERLDIANKAGAFRQLNNIQRGASTHDESWFTSYKQLTDIYAYMDVQVAAHPDLVTKADIGNTIQARDIFAFTITAPDEPGNLATDRPVILWNGCQHAREWVSPMTVTYIASKLIDDAQSDPEVAALLGSVRFVIVPVSNPDGYLYTWSTERYWRKNRRNNAGSSFGVDLNRNWNVAWSGDGASGDPNSDTYYGTAPFSEPETTAISNLAIGYGPDLAAHIDYHTFSQLVLWPLGYATGLVTPEPDRTNFINLSNDISSLIQSISGEFYNPIQSWQLYAAAGTCSDWFYDDRGVTSFTIELRPADGGFDGFSPPDTIILPTAQENWEAAKLFAARTTQAMSLSHTVPQAVDADTPTPVTLTASPGISEVDSSSAVLHTRIGTSGAFTDISMVDAGASTFVAHLPGTPCGQTIEYYFTADSLSGVSLSFPFDGASSPLSTLAQVITIAIDDDMETNTGWTVGQASDTATTGIWERTNPQSTAAQPEDDHTPGAGTLCWITDGAAGASLGANDVDGGATTLTSPTLDASATGAGAELVYWRWYSNNSGASPDADSMLVQISENNGGSWTELETVTENTGQWVEKRFPVTPSSQIRVRFIASDIDSGSIVEAGVDDLRIQAVGCPNNPADLNGDGDLNFLDVSQFLALFGSQDPLADFNNDGQWNFLDVSAFLAAFGAG
jgi:carboxypeptidase A1